MELVEKALRGFFLVFNVRKIHQAEGEWFQGDIRQFSLHFKPIRKKNVGAKTCLMSFVLVLLSS